MELKCAIFSILLAAAGFSMAAFERDNSGKPSRSRHEAETLMETKLQGVCPPKRAREAFMKDSGGYVQRLGPTSALSSGCERDAGATGQGE